MSICRNLTLCIIFLTSRMLTVVVPHDKIVNHTMMQTALHRHNRVKPWRSGPGFNIRGLIVRSREVSKPRDVYLKLSDGSEIWQAPRHQCCRRACQISKRCDDLNYQSRGFETWRCLTIRRLIGYWNEAQVSLLETRSAFITMVFPTAFVISNNFKKLGYSFILTPSIDF